MRFRKKKLILKITAPKNGINQRHQLNLQIITYIMLIDEMFVRGHFTNILQNVNIYYITHILKFKHSILYSLIFLEAAHFNRLCLGATDKDIEDVAKDWLRFAKDQSGGRKGRLKTNDNGNEQNS